MLLLLLMLRLVGEWQRWHLGVRRLLVLQQGSQAQLLRQVAHFVLHAHAQMSGSRGPQGHVF